VQSGQSLAVIQWLARDTMADRHGVPICFVFIKSISSFCLVWSLFIALA
jgi:hypothetical protein